MDWVYRNAEILLRHHSDGELLSLSILAVVDAVFAFFFYREFKRGVVTTKYGDGRYTRDGQSDVFWTITAVRCVIVVLLSALCFQFWRHGP